VCYSNVLVCYSWVQGYCCVCVTLIVWCSTFGYMVAVVCACVLLLCVLAVELGTGLLLCVCYFNVL